VNRLQALLHIGAGAHLGRRPQQEADCAIPYPPEQLGFRLVAVVVMNELNLFSRNPFVYQKSLDLIVNIEALVVRRSQIGKHQLRCLDGMRLFPDAHHVVSSQRQLSCWIKWQEWINQPDVQCGIAANIRHLEHVVILRPD